VREHERDENPAMHCPPTGESRRFRRAVPQAGIAILVTLMLPRFAGAEMVWGFTLDSWGAGVAVV